LYNQKVIAIDVPIKNKEIISEGLLIENGDLKRIDFEGKITRLF
jgi:hypothetical protein